MQVSRQVRTIRVRPVSRRIKRDITHAEEEIFHPRDREKISGLPALLLADNGLDPEFANEFLLRGSPALSALLSTR